jgi:hypothetical protein
MKRRENRRPTDHRRPPQHRSEFPTGYSSAGCSPAEPASASPVAASIAQMVIDVIPRRTRAPSRNNDEKCYPCCRFKVLPMFPIAHESVGTDACCVPGPAAFVRRCQEASI